MKLNEKYFLNSLLSVAPLCALPPSVVGAYNKVYAVRGSACPSPIFCFATLRKTSHTLKHYLQYCLGCQNKRGLENGKIRVRKIEP